MISEDKYFEGVMSYKLLAKHEVGQNFLVDKNAARKIVEIAEIQPSDRVLEIGPGAGSLSYYIAHSGASADLVDIDEGLIAKLKADFEGVPNLHPIYGNALKADYAPYQKIIGNLPYYITSSLIERILIFGKSMQKAVLMVQKEAFSRLSAAKGSKDYGPLPVLLSYRGAVKKEFVVPRSSFAPEPHVDSVVFSVTSQPIDDPSFAENFYAMLNACFLHRRKTILNNLTGFLNGESRIAKEALDIAGIEQTRRPETLSLEDYLKLSKALEALPLPLKE